MHTKYTVGFPGQVKTQHIAEYLILRSAPIKYVMMTLSLGFRYLRWNATVSNRIDPTNPENNLKHFLLRPPSFPLSQL